MNTIHSQEIVFAGNNSGNNSGIDLKQGRGKHNNYRKRKQEHGFLEHMKERFPVLPFFQYGNGNESSRYSPE
ncbi:MAG: hypothetical protein V2A54_02015, partial [Bacteroidota bacterium]